MGIFSKKSIYCLHCNKDITKETRWNISGGFICNECKKLLKQFGIYESSELMKLSVNDVNEIHNKIQSGDVRSVYIGWGGKIIIDSNDTVTLNLNFPTASYECRDIQGVAFLEPDGLTNGFLIIIADNITHNVSFTNRERDEFVTAYFHLKQYTPGGAELVNGIINFEDSKTVAGFLHIDEEQEKWYLGHTTLNCEAIYEYSDVEEVYTLKGDKITTSVASGKRKGGIARGVVGGVIAGATGAIIGTLTASTETSATSTEIQKIYVNIYVTGSEEPLSILCSNEFIADEMQRAFSLMVKKLDESNSSNNSLTSSTADEIRKYKTLLDDGIITQEEFGAKKKQLLDI